MADPSKIETMMNLPTAKTIKQLRALLGLMRYHCRFIYQFAIIVAPLTKLLNKNGFQLKKEAETTFNWIKQVMTSSTPVLRLSDFTFPFVIESDTFDVGMSAMLIQDGKPIAYFSKKLGAKMQKGSTYIRELSAITK